MKWSAPIANETEFQEWLASVLESERERLREEAARESRTHMSFKVAMENIMKETRHHEDQR
jgi:hypothetical protein